MLLLGEVSDPEPPPNFWPLFAARVSSAIHEDASARERAGLFVSLPRWGWLAAAVSIALLAVAAAVVLQRGPGGPAAPLQPSADRVLGVDLDAGAADAGAAPVEQDEAWALLVEAGADVDWDVVAASGFVPAPGSVEGAVTHLTEAERAELARLLEVALGGNPE